MNERLDLTRALVTTAVVIAVGHGSGIAVAEPGQIAWRVHFDGLYTDFEPVVAPDGTIITGNADFVTAVNPDGSIRWRTTATAREGETSVGPDGTVYAVSGTSIIALDAFDGGCFRKLEKILIDSGWEPCRNDTADNAPTLTRPKTAPPAHDHRSAGSVVG